MIKEEFISNAKKYINYHYLYGYKGEIITNAKNKEFTALYPKIWKQSKYISKSKQWEGDRAIDCSGLVCRALGWKIGKNIGSYDMGEKWENVKTPSAGLVAWKPGHVAICLNESQIIEASGIDTGVRIRSFKKSEFKKYLKVPEVEYNAGFTGWVWDDKKEGWQYLHNGEPLDTGLFTLPWSGGLDRFVFYNKYCYITDSDGVIISPKNA